MPGKKSELSMNHANLTARYRPQTFAEVAGQDLLCAILSRAAAEDKVAPAYLFSGTRGVGKTTLARVFAKALNCVRSPAAEPCNVCDHCRQITLGTDVDVREIDGASNRGIDDVRRLKEEVGYAPMAGRYKIFIIDEAHMLSREAFNALLKTLEEPPPRVVFIMATTEEHKIPATIRSRCQHYVFKRLTESALERHLADVLQKEGAPFDEAALRLLARRAAGSVRDGMSLLGQVLALTGEALTQEDTRQVLGLAGQELFFRLMEAFRQGDSLTVAELVRELLHGGLDLGFFLRELAFVWRCLFMFKEAGEAALSVLELPEAEAQRWLEFSRRMGAAHIHAAWQMTLEGQRRVFTSMEPGLALELLLLNIALLPRLLPIGQLDGPPAEATPPPQGPTTGADGARTAPETPAKRESAAPRAEAATHAADTTRAKEPSPPPEGASWEGFLRHAAAAGGGSPELRSLLQAASGSLDNGVLRLTPRDAYTQRRLGQQDKLDALAGLARTYYGEHARVELAEAPERATQADAREQLGELPAVQLVMQEFTGTRILRSTE